MKKTYKELIAHCKSTFASGVRYVYGTKMETLTEQKFLMLQSMYGTDYVPNSDSKKVGKVCCDCSGLISSLTGITRNSAAYRNTAAAEYTIDYLFNHWNDCIGFGLWTSGHIGVVSDKYGYFYAMQNSSENCVHKKLLKTDFRRVIKLCDIDYTKEVKPVTTERAIDVLRINGVISTPDYWYYAVRTTKYVDELLKSSAKKILELGGKSDE